MTNTDIIKVLGRLATMLEIDGANPFRVRAYREAARVIDAMGDPAAALDATSLAELPGIGKDLAGKIRDIIDTGTTALFEEMKAKIPLDVVALTDLQGMGPKRVKLLLDRGINSRERLEEAARSKALRQLPGFGETMEVKILQAIERAQKAGERKLLAAAWPIGIAFAEQLRKVPGVTQVEVAGSFRRRKETVGDLDLLVCGGAAEDVMTTFVSQPEVGEVLGRGETKSSVRLLSGLQVDLRLVPEASFGAAMLYFTGSKPHNIELRRVALDQGMSLSEYGLTRDGTMVAGRTEEEVYRALGMAWIPPELREARDEIERARNGTLPRLIEESDVRGDLHMHTNRTDGREPLEVMVRAARDRGYAYCAITDHSKSLAMSGGFDTARVRQSVAEIEAVRRQVPGIEVLHGLEVDILGDGSLDLDDEGLALLDWVIISLHSRLTQPRTEMTLRVMRALEHPAVHVMGHPTARYIGEREPVEIDMERVLDHAAKHGVLMEINSQPKRVDLHDVHARMAKERGIPLVISTDAHSVGQMDYLRYGVFAARRAGLQAADVLNTRDVAGLRTALRRGAGPSKAPPAASATPTKRKSAPKVARSAARPASGSPAPPTNRKKSR